MKISKLVLNVSLALMAGVASTHASAATKKAKPVARASVAAKAKSEVRSSASTKSPGSDTTTPVCKNAQKGGRYEVTAADSAKSARGTVSAAGKVEGQN
jgi:hypothetical protein